MDKTERQLVGIKKGVQAKGHATGVGGTGTGKTFGAIMLVERILKQKPDADILIVVPTQILKEQGLNEYIIPRNLLKNCRTVVINSAIKEEHTTCDLLILDEVHRFASETFQHVFECVEYSMILCLTGTLERLDGKEQIIKMYAPVCDTITLDEAEKNGGVSPVKQYCVMLDVPLSDYKSYDKKFNACFAFFNYDFNIAMKCATDINYRRKYAKQTGYGIKEVTGMAMGGMKSMRNRKSFVMSHPHKIDVARKIIEARKDRKIITFSATIKDAESINIGYVLHSQKSEKQNKETIEAFNNAQSGVLNSSKAADQGLDVKGLSVGIILSTDSSKIRATQRRGRICRFEQDKKAELFTLVIRGTQEQNWFNNSSTGDVIYITEDQLDDVLAGKEIKSRQRDQTSNVKYRF